MNFKFIPNISPSLIFPLMCVEFSTLGWRPYTVEDVLEAVSNDSDVELSDEDDEDEFEDDDVMLEMEREDDEKEEAAVFEWFKREFVPDGVEWLHDNEQEVVDAMTDESMSLQRLFRYFTEEYDVEFKKSKRKYICILF